jgi:hypothetical protein
VDLGLRLTDQNQRLIGPNKPTEYVEHGCTPHEPLKDHAFDGARKLYLIELTLELYQYLNQVEQILRKYVEDHWQELAGDHPKDNVTFIPSVMGPNQEGKMILQSVLWKLRWDEDWERGSYLDHFDAHGFYCRHQNWRCLSVGCHIQPTISPYKAWFNLRTGNWGIMFHLIEVKVWTCGTECKE